MNTILNVIWVLLAGLWLAIGYFFAGIVYCLLIVTIPFGVASFRLAGYVIWPFGRDIAREPTTGALTLIGNILWFIFGGLGLALGHLVTGILQAITIIGIPLAIANWKMVPLALWPLGARVVDKP
ncbi:YccF domain-containing protein [Haloglycomyces albus]|uniref:YccF domain-containing protein n=1 Tax=Haloglycomyces albus TaxID=526067 RepID=UPI00046D8483|nr:YccF domain-containing protein [Haloglycomyces albus]